MTRSGAARVRRRAAALALLLMPAVAQAASAGADPGMAGVPAGGGLVAEGTCTVCHTGSALNPDAAGKIEILGLPERYAPGERYALELRLAHPDATRARWGFQLTAVDAKSFARAGDLVVTDTVATQRLDGGAGDRQYLEQTLEGTGIGTSGEQRWRFAWVAPAAGAGDVAFFGAGNAANADGSNQGDWIFNPSPAPLATVRAPGD